MKLIILSSVTALLLCAACGSATYRKNGASRSDFQRDSTECLVKANQAGYTGGDFSSNLARHHFLVNCIEGEGWEKI